MITLLLFFMFVNLLHADYNILYDTITMDVQEYGYQNQYEVPSNLKWSTIKENNPVLKSNNIADISYNPNSKTVIPKSQAEVNRRRNFDLKIKLQKEMYKKQKELDFELWNISKQFDVSRSTTELQNEINLLESTIKSIR